MPQHQYTPRSPGNAEQHAYMAMRQEQNVIASKHNPNELWMASLLERTSHKFNRQRRWGYRIFDFWCSELGVAVEVDGLEHRPEYDRMRDDHHYNRSGILVLRARNRNEEDAREVLARIATARTWNERRLALGLKPIKYGTPPLTAPATACI